MAKTVHVPKLPKFAKRGRKPREWQMIHFPKRGITYVIHADHPSEEDKADAEDFVRRWFGS